MLKPDYENKMVNRGIARVAGVDEAGRGPWAGPVVAACLLFDDRIKSIELADSKKLSAKKRERIFDFLADNFDYGIGVVSHELIDEIGILSATRLAMGQAINGLSDSPDYLLIDAVDLTRETGLPQESIISGDATVWSIAAASIVAKVTRDRIMKHYHILYPEYGFNRHKGYGTKLHREMLHQYGVCQIHRKSYAPVAAVIN